MIIVGASGHAKEVFDCLENHAEIYFFDNITKIENPYLFNKKIIQSFETISQNSDNNFVLGIGNPIHRFNLYQTFSNLNCKIQSVIAKNSQISSSANLEDGVNIMSFAFIGPNTLIGKGSLINVHAAIHHDAVIEQFVEVSPGAKILGNVKVGAFSSVGSNATILPKIIIGKNVVVAAGAVVTKNIPDNCMVAGVPAQIKKQLKPLKF